MVLFTPPSSLKSTKLPGLITTEVARLITAGLVMRDEFLQDKRRASLALTPLDDNVVDLLSPFLRLAECRRLKSRSPCVKIGISPGWEVRISLIATRASIQAPGGERSERLFVLAELPIGFARHMLRHIFADGLL